MEDKQKGYRIRMKEEFRILEVITSSYETQPPEVVLGTYKVMWGQPVRSILKPEGYEWHLIHTDDYDLYRQLDLNWDLKTLEDAREYLESIDQKIKRLEWDKGELTKLLT